MIGKLSNNLKDFFGLVLIPSLAIFLPWPLCFRLFRCLARFPFLYSQQTAAVLNGARSIGFIQDAGDWSSAYRLTQLVDHADFYLSRFRSYRWMDRYLTVEGDSWPSKGTPFLAISFHWGAGLWIFRHLHRRGITSAFLFRDFENSTLSMQPVRQCYYRWRIGEVERGGNAPAVRTGPNTTGRLLDTLARGHSVVALVDVPPDSRMTCLPIRLFGRQAWFPRGLIRLAVDEKLPVMGFTLGLDRKTGRRILTVRGPLPNHDEQALAQALADLFTEALTQDPVAWHFWPFVQDFLHWEKKSEKPRSAGGSAGC